MAFQQTLQEMRDTHIQDTNWRTIEAVEAILEKAVVPVEAMRKTLLEGAKRGTYARAAFLVDFISLLLYPVPLSLYVVNKRHPTQLQKVVLDKGTIRTQHQMIEPLFQSNGFFQGVRRIQDELVAAFPDGEINMCVLTQYDVNSSLLLEFSVSYTLKNPEGLLVL
jgi:hypothetical protein